MVNEVRNLAENTFKGAAREAAAKLIPYYNLFESQVVPYLNREKGKLLGKRKPATIVDRGEISASFSNLNAQLGGTYNPIKVVFNLLRRIAGNTRLERTQGELSQLKEYSGLYDNYLFANETLNFLKTKIDQEISKKEGILSKLGLRQQTKKINADPVISELKATFNSWLQPFEQILSGGVKGVSLYKADIEFLKTLKSSLMHSNHAQYVKDLASRVDTVLGKILKHQQEQRAGKFNQVSKPHSQTRNHPTHNNRAAAEHLTSLAA